MTRLTVDMIEFLGAGIAHQLGACSRSGRPSICRGLAASHDSDGVAVLLSGQAGYELVAAVRETGHVSAVFTLPQTFRTVHLKGRDAVVDLAGPAWRPLLDQRRAAFAAQIAPYGFPAGYTDAWYTVPDDDLMVVRFTPYAAWDQTPGPGAGKPLELGP